MATATQTGNRRRRRIGLIPVTAMRLSPPARPRRRPSAIAATRPLDQTSRADECVAAVVLPPAVHMCPARPGPPRYDIVRLASSAFSVQPAACRAAVRSRPCTVASVVDGLAPAKTFAARPASRALSIAKLPLRPTRGDNSAPLPAKAMRLR